MPSTLFTSPLSSQLSAHTSVCPCCHRGARRVALETYLGAGLAPAVRCFPASLVSGLQHIGLEVNLEKTEVIPHAPLRSPFGPL